jgi:hypothetical protein
MNYSRRFRSPWLLMAGAYSCLGALALTGCAAARFETEAGRNKQLGMTALMALDTAQTVTIAREPGCLYEANPIAAGVFGSRNPSPQRVLLTNAAYIAGHWMVGAYLDRQAEAPIDLAIDAKEDIARRERYRFLRSLYQFFTVFGHGAAVASNQFKGIRPFGSYECGAGQ